MADSDFIDPSAICQRGSITQAEIATIRRNYYKDGIVSETEADALFAIERSCPLAPAAWGPLFVEAITDYLVHQVKPEGYLTAENGAWLTGRISVNGKISSRIIFDLLVKILDESRWAPASLTTLALAQVRDAVVNGKGPLRAGGKPALGVITSSDVSALRSILYAAGGDGNIGVTRAEAEVLMDIADAADDTLSDPAWTDLYTKAIANHLLAAHGYAPPTRQEALKQEAWLEAEPDLGGFLGDMVRSGLRGVWDAYHTPDVEDLALAKLEEQKRAILVDEEIAAPEAAWLAERINRDGRVSDAELALLSFLKANSSRIDPSLDALMARVA